MLLHLTHGSAVAHELSQSYGLWSTIYSQFRRWWRCGVWDVVLAWLAKQAEGTLRHVDGSYIKLHQHGLQGSRQTRAAEAIGLSRCSMTTKQLPAVNESGHLCAVVLTSGSLHDQTAARHMLKAFRDIHFVGDKGFDSLSLRQALACSNCALLLSILCLTTSPVANSVSCTPKASAKL